jgi:hypothetical protein
MIKPEKVGNFELTVIEFADGQYGLYIGLDILGHIYTTNFALSYYGAGFNKTYPTLEHADYAFEEARRKILEKIA